MGYLLLPVLMLLQSCASIISDNTYPVVVRVEPADAQLNITDRKGREVFNGKAPTIVYLKAGTGYFARQKYQMTLSKDGYNSTAHFVKFKLDGWYFGNIVFGGLIGFLIVDPLTGAMWRIDNSYYDVILKELARPEKLNQETQPEDFPKGQKRLKS